MEGNLSQPQSIPGDVSPSQGDCPDDFEYKEIQSASIENSQAFTQVINNKEKSITASKNQYLTRSKSRSLSPQRLPKIKIKPSKKTPSSVGKREKKEKSEERKLKKKLSRKKLDNITLKDTIAFFKKNSNNDSSFNESFSIELYENPLSPPPKHLSRLEQVLWLQERRIVGLWVYCDRPGCNKMRWLEDVVDPNELPEYWYCSMNPDPNFNDCSIREKGPTIQEEVDLINNLYNCGSLVWARVPGWPWWPGIVDDDPDILQYYWLEDDDINEKPTHYHVVFFDSEKVTRAWITPKFLKNYINNPSLDKQVRCNKKYKSRIEAAKKQANDAAQLNVRDRLAKWSFVARWPDQIVTPPSSSDETTDSNSDEKENRREKTKKKKRKSKKTKKNKEDRKKYTSSASQRLNELCDDILTDDETLSTSTNLTKYKNLVANKPKNTPINIESREDSNPKQTPKGTKKDTHKTSMDTSAKIKSNSIGKKQKPRHIEETDDSSDEHLTQNPQNTTSDQNNNIAKVIAILEEFSENILTQNLIGEDSNLSPILKTNTNASDIALHQTKPGIGLPDFENSKTENSEQVNSQIQKIIQDLEDTEVPLTQNLANIVQPSSKTVEQHNSAEKILSKNKAKTIAGNSNPLEKVFTQNKIEKNGHKHIDRDSKSAEMVLTQNSFEKKGSKTFDKESKSSQIVLTQNSFEKNTSKHIDRDSKSAEIALTQNSVEKKSKNIDKESKSSEITLTQKQPKSKDLVFEIENSTSKILKQKNQSPKTPKESPLKIYVQKSKTPETFKVLNESPAISQSSSESEPSIMQIANNTASMNSDKTKESQQKLIVQTDDTILYSIDSANINKKLVSEEIIPSKSLKEKKNTDPKSKENTADLTTKIEENSSIISEMDSFKFNSDNYDGDISKMSVDPLDVENNTAILDKLKNFEEKIKARKNRSPKEKKLKKEKKNAREGKEKNFKTKKGLTVPSKGFNVPKSGVSSSQKSINSSQVSNGSIGKRKKLKPLSSSQQSSCSQEKRHHEIIKPNLQTKSKPIKKIEVPSQSVPKRSLGVGLRRTKKPNLDTSRSSDKNSNLSDTESVYSTTSKKSLGIGLRNTKKKESSNISDTESVVSTSKKSLGLRLRKTKPTLQNTSKFSDTESVCSTISTSRKSLGLGLSKKNRKKPADSSDSESVDISVKRDLKKIKNDLKDEEVRVESPVDDVLNTTEEVLSQYLL